MAKASKPARGEHGKHSVNDEAVTLAESARALRRMTPVVVNTVDPVSSIADQVVQGNTATSTYGVTGSGITIGIISDSFNTKGKAAADEADGALPSASNVHILQEGNSSTGTTDEGRAMAEIAHSIAPGAAIDFYTCGTSDANMATAITALQQAGCQIIVDDVSFLDEPFFEEGDTISQAIASAVSKGVSYFTAASNAANSFYEATFTPITATVTKGGSKVQVQAENFGTASNPSAWENLTIPIGYSVIIDLQWAQPYLTSLGIAKGTGATSTLDFNLVAGANGVGNLVKQGAGNVDGSDPVEFYQYTNNTSSTSFSLAIFQSAGVKFSGLFKVIMDDDSSSPVTFTGPTAGGVGDGDIYGHEEDPNAITVGAVPENSPTTMEVYSSTGPGEFLYDSNGNLLSQPVTANAVDVSAPDGNSTDVFNPFYGTSAAAPAAAAVGALMLQANSQLNNSDIENLLEDTATAINASSNVAGAGLVNANASVGLAETLTFQLTTSTTTVLGTHLADTFVGGPGNHTIIGEGGGDELNYSAAPGGVSVNFVTGTASNGYGGTDTFGAVSTVLGSAFNDTFIVGPASETIYGEGGTDTVNFNALALSDLLTLTDGSFTSTSISNLGYLIVSVGGALQLTGTSVANSGEIEVGPSSNVDIAGAVTGAGTLYDNGGVLELGGADGESVSIFGAGTLKLDNPLQFTAQITGMSLGAIIDFAHVTVNSANFAGSTLTVNETGGAVVQLHLPSNLSSDSFAEASDGAGGTQFTLATRSLPLAQATIAPSNPIALGNARVGGTLAEALTIRNSATSPAEGLDASIASTTGAASASSAVSLLAAGQSDSGDVTLGLNTTSAGQVSGTANLALASDGANTDGLVQTPLAGQTVQLSGTVYNEASASFGLPANFIVHIGDTVAQALTVTNAAPSAYSENLIAGVASTGGAITASGTTGEIAAQSSSNAITLGFSTATAGTVAGSVTVGLQTDGTGIDGFGPTALASQTVNVNATVNNYAVASLEELSGGGIWTASGNNYSLNLGTLAQGATAPIIDLGILNSALGPADLLAGNFSIATPNGFTNSGFSAFSGAAAGSTDSLPTIQFSANTAGTFTETITLNPTGSNASGYSSALAPEILSITATRALPLAQATIAPVALGNARVGGTLGTTLTVTNSATAPAEALDASVASTTGAASGSSSVSLLAAGQSDSGDVVVGLSTATAGAVSGTVNLALESDGANTDGLGQTPLAGQAVQLSGTVYNEASASFGLPANFIVHIGDTVAQALTVTNAAPSAYSENLIAGVASTGGAITASGTTGEIAAQSSSNALTVGFSTATAGTVAGSVTVGLQTDGTGIDGFGPTALASQTVNVNATVNNYAVASLEELSGGGIWTASGNNYSLNLGTLAQGATAPVIDLGILNSALGPADLLAGNFSIATPNGFTNSGFSAFSGLAAGSADTVPTVTINTSTAGTFTETITLNPTGSNASGYSGALAAETLSITATIAASTAWIGPTIKNRSGDWNTASNWNPAMVPTAATKAIINASGTYTVTNSQANTVAGLTIGNAGTTLAVNGGPLSIAGVVSNAGTIGVTDGNTLQLTNTVTNTGNINLNATGDATQLAVVGTLALKGTGTVAMSSAAGNTIDSNGVAATLNNASNIVGTGTIGDTNLTLFNQLGGVIDARTGDNLTLNTATTVKSTGTIETTGGQLTVVNALSNTGSLSVAGGILAVEGAVTGTGNATISGGTLDFAGNVATTQTVTFAAATGTLALDHAQGFQGTVAGMAGSDAIDLTGFAFKRGPTLSVSGSSAAGADTVVTITDGTLVAAIKLLNATAGEFALNSSAYALSTDHTGNPTAGTLFTLANTSV